MKLLSMLSTKFLIHLFGWSLLHFVWEGVLLAVLVACALKALSGQSARLRYAVACCGLILMAFLPVITFATLVAGSQGMTQTISYPAGDSGTLIRFHGVLGGPEDSWLLRMSVALDHALPWILTAWFLGTILFLGRLNLGLLMAQRLKSTATQAVPAELQEMFHALKQRLGMDHAVKLVASTRVQVPTVIGWLRPVILLPVGCLLGLSPSQIEAILAHELAHIRRHDYLVSVFQSFAEALLFYHPAVWWVSAQVRKERELCCDDIAVQITGDSLGYAKALALLEESRSFYPLTSLGANGGALVMRIRRLLGCKETSAFSQWAGMALLALVVGGGAAVIGTLAHAQATADRSANAEAAEEQNLPAMYRTWLDEDVRWIISPEERSAFLKMVNNEERDQFITQFWSRRADVSVGGEQDFKAKYYGRIAYANQHFAGDMPGWQTDRGRIFILYGRPDSIDSHPSATSTSKPYEVWHYRVIQEAATVAMTEPVLDKPEPLMKKDVDFRFVDTCSCGSYKLLESLEKQDVK